MRTPGPSRTLLAALGPLCAIASVGCAPDAPTPPSILLIVLDTLRADAVSAYGATQGTTPALDALAADGMRYTQAFAPASWTLPSHATLLTGLGVERHGVGLEGRMRLSEEVVTLAERLGEAGYQTTGFSENLMVSPPFGFGQGFGTYSTDTLGLPDPVMGPFELFDRLAIWEGLPKDVPFFLFVNIMDPHDPYEVRDQNPFLPEGVSATTASAVQRPDGLGIADASGICDALPPRDEREILRGLYLGDVQAADAKLGRILETVQRFDHEVITIVTSDHGEHLGEHALLGHEYTVRNVALQIPLVVHGAPDLPPGESDTPVTLADVSASILAWAGLEIPAEFAGRRLPAPGIEASDRSLIAVFSDVPWIFPDTIRGVSLHEVQNQKRDDCRPEHRVFGDLYAVMRPPYKLIETPGFPPQLYDLRWDRLERSDIASHQQQVVETLAARLAEFRARLPKGAGAPLDPSAAEALRSLGYGE